ncbi:TPA: HNH endonuclease [Providencia stuartii]|nr:HNH endonuclease [Providencia stuartii]
MDYSLTELSGIFSCDPEKGEIYWLPRDRSHFSSDFAHQMWNLRNAGKVAGGRNGSGYMVATSGDMKVLVHRAIWIFANGEIPSDLYIDHINHIRHDNRISNLRLVTAAQNGRNQSMHGSNISGVNGVYWNSKIKKWVASINTRGSNITLGHFCDIEDAINAREAANKRFCFHPNHGRDRYLDVEYIDPWNRVK